MIEPDIDLVRSTRRWGGPITWAKRALVHVLRQYLGQIVAEQTRFNLHAAVRLAELEERIERLEKPRTTRRLRQLTPCSPRRRRSRRGWRPSGRRAADGGLDVAQARAGPRSR